MYLTAHIRLGDALSQLVIYQGIVQNDILNESKHYVLTKYLYRIVYVDQTCMYHV